MKTYTKANISLLAAFLLILGICFNSSFSQIVLAQSQDELNQKEESSAEENLSNESLANEEQIEPKSDTQLPYKYYGNSFSHKFHRPSCPFGEAISKRHLVLFHFRHEAIEAHYAPCRYCLPPVWCKVHGVLLQKTPKDIGSNSPIIKEPIEENDNNDTVSKK